MPFQKFAVGAEDWDGNDDFVARIMRIENDGREVEVAISEFVSSDDQTLAGWGAIDTRLSNTQRCDAEGHPIVLAKGENPMFVKVAVDVLCQYVLDQLIDMKRGVVKTPEEESYFYSNCLRRAVAKGGGEKEARAEHEEIHRRRRVLIERYLDKRRQEGKDVEGIIGDPSDCVES